MLKAKEWTMDLTFKAKVSTKDLQTIVIYKLYLISKNQKKCKAM